MAIPSISQNLADAYLTAFKAFVNDSGGAAKIQIYAGDPYSSGVKLAEALLDTTTPFAATTTSSGYRQTVPTPEGGNADLTIVGLAAAGAGTNATHYRLLAESGAVVEVGTCRGAGDSDTGQQMVLSNKNIAENQAVTITSFVKRVAMALGNI